MKRTAASLLTGVSLTCASPALAQTIDAAALQRELAAARSELAAQRQQINEQETRLRALEARLTAVGGGAPNGSTPAQVATTAPAPAVAGAAGVEQVGEAPEFDLEMPQVAVLGDQGNVITRAGQLTLEPQLEFARADRNRALFRGIEVVESVLVGVFDVNESRQNVLTAALGARYGVASNLEVGVKVPYIHRSDTSILAPIAGTSGDPAATIDNSAKGSGIGDVELMARYQLTRAGRGRPFLIGNLGVVIPTGSNPFAVPRDALGRSLEAPTGAGFWSVSPSVTAILPSDPAVLFGTIGYARNFARDVDTIIPPVIIERVDPGDSVSASVGIGIALNQRTSFNLGYAHSWAFGTTTWTRPLEPGPNDVAPTISRSRDLQLGRLLFGVTYRVNERTSVNWAVEIGATEDATDLRTTLRVPFVL